MKIILLCLLLGLAHPVYAADAVGTCPTAKVGERAPACSVPVVCAVPAKANDMVRTIVAGIQVWEPYDTLTLGSSVAPCSGGWSTLAAQGIPLFSSLTPPVTPPPVVPTVPPPQSVTVTAVDMPAASALFPNLPNPECFTLSNGTQSVTVCLPKNP